MDDLDFIVDTKASEDSHTSKSAFPVFSNSKYRLESEDEEGDESEQSENDGDSDSDEYFGKFIYFRIATLASHKNIFQVFHLHQSASKTR